jgi:glyoxylase-like metal-dependent hydrolase (beta-lactamase superfamily II)
MEIIPGFTTIATPGHTPGQTSFVVASGSAKVFVQSDVTNIAHLFSL